MADPTSKRPKRKPNNTHVFDPTPPEPVSNSCEFCKGPISQEDLETPGIICTECCRPTCPNCRAIITQAGLKGCFFCTGLELDERNETVKKELKRIREELLKEREVKPPPITFPPPMSTSTPMVITTDNTDTATPVTFNIVANTEVGNDQYPYRDPPNVMDREEGWGIGPTDWDDDDEVKPMTAEIWKQARELIIKGEAIDKKPITLDEKHAQIFNRVDWNAVETILGIKFTEDNKHSIIDAIKKDLIADRFIKQKYPKIMPPGSGKEAEEVMARTKEEAYRGTGRTTTHVKAMINHFTGKFKKGWQWSQPETKRVLYIGEDRRYLGAAGRMFQFELQKKFGDEVGMPERIQKRVDFVTVDAILHSRVRLAGRHYTLIITDLDYVTVMMKGKEIEQRVAPYILLQEEGSIEFEGSMGFKG